MEKTKIPDVAAEAEAVILKLMKDNNKIALTTNQIRRFLSAVNTMTIRIMVYHAGHTKDKGLPLELAA